MYSACKDIPKLTIQERYECGILKNKNATLKVLEASRAVESRKHAPYESKPIIPKTAPVKTTNTKTTASKTTKPTASKKGTLSFAAVKKTDTKKPAVKAETTKSVAKKVISGTKRKADHGRFIKLSYASFFFSDVYFNRGN